MSHRNLFKVDQRASQANFQPIRTTAGERRHQQSPMVNQRLAKARDERWAFSSLLFSGWKTLSSCGIYIYLMQAASTRTSIPAAILFSKEQPPRSPAVTSKTTLISPTLGRRLSWKPTKMDSRDEVISRMQRDCCCVPTTLIYRDGVLCINNSAPLSHFQHLK